MDLRLLLVFEAIVIFHAAAADKRLLMDTDSEPLTLLQVLQTRIDQLNATHVQENNALRQELEAEKTKSTSLQSQLTAETSKIAALRSELDAEKKERCRTGRLSFHKEENCQSHSCKETQTVTFNPPFTKTPTVTVALSEIDMENDMNIRVDSGVDLVTSSKTVVYVNVWSDTVLYKAVVSWIACPSL